MGVKELWGLVSPTGELLPLTALEGQAVAVDLSCWVVDTQALQLGYVVRPHLRNLLFRTLALLYAGILPVFVVEGDAPSLKWNTISSRNQRNFHHPTGTKKQSIKTGKRSHFRSVLKECCELFDLLGVPWVQASGEAEATCAALCYHQMVKGVITQDSDIFLYGGRTVFRNFTANQSKATVEKFSMDILEDRLQLTRGGLIVLAILLGCDYLPGGVQGVGRDTAVKLLRAWYKAGERDPVQRMCSWASQPNKGTQGSKLSSTKWKNGNDDELENGVKERLRATDGFPFKDIIQEFQKKLSCSAKKICWAQPSYEELVKWCIRKLDWNPAYAIEKISPAVTRWSLTQGTMLRCLKPVEVVKHCVRRGIAACVVQWRVITHDFPHETPEYLTTDEPLHLTKKSLPQLLHMFEEKASALKKGKRKNRKIKDDAKVLDKDETQLLKDDSRNQENKDPRRLGKDDPRNLAKNSHRKTDENDPKKLDKSNRKLTTGVNKKLVNNFTRDTDDKGQSDGFIFKSCQNGSQQMSISDEFDFDKDHHTSKVKNTDLKEEEEEEEISLIIDRIIKINMNGQPSEDESMNMPAFECRSDEQKMTQVSTLDQMTMAQSNGLYSRHGKRKEKVNIRNMSRQKFFDSEIEEEVYVMEEDKENQPEGLFDRVSKRIAERSKNKEKSSFSPLHQPKLSFKLHKDSFSCLKINNPVGKYGNIAQTDGESPRKTTVTGCIRDDFEASRCSYVQSDFSGSSRVLMEMEILHENNKSGESKVYHGSHISFVQDSPRSKSEAVSCGEVSKDLFDDTDETLGVVSPHCSLLPKLHSTPCLSSSKTTVRRNSLNISLKSVLSSPKTCVVEMYPKNQSFYSLFSSGEDLRDSFSKSLHIKSHPYYSTRPSSKISEIPLDNTPPRLHNITVSEKDIPNLNKQHLTKGNESGPPLDDCSKAAFCSTLTISNEKNWEDVCFKLTDSSFDSKSSSLFELDILEPSPSRVTPTRGRLQQSTDIKQISGEYIGEKNIVHGEHSCDTPPILFTLINENGLRNDEVKFNKLKIEKVVASVEEDENYCKQEESEEVSLCTRTDDKSAICDPFSPLGVGLTLTERLKVRFPSKTFTKLLDDL